MLARVLSGGANLLEILEDATSGKESRDKLIGTDNYFLNSSLYNRL